MPPLTASSLFLPLTFPSFFLPCTKIQFLFIFKGGEEVLFQFRDKKEEEEVVSCEFWQLATIGKYIAHHETKHMLTLKANMRRAARTKNILKPIKKTEILRFSNKSIMIEIH